MSDDKTFDPPLGMPDSAGHITKEFIDKQNTNWIESELLPWLDECAQKIDVHGCYFESVQATKTIKFIKKHKEHWK